MISERKRLSAGWYRALTTAVVSLYQGNREVSWRQIEAGDEFEVPEGVNGFWTALVWCPGYEATPRIHRLEV